MSLHGLVQRMARLQGRHDALLPGFGSFGFLRIRDPTVDDINPALPYKVFRLLRTPESWNMGLG